MKRGQQGGFSLLEMLIVLVLLVLISAIAIPTLLKSIRSYQLESAGRRVANMALRARYEAMQRNQRVCAAFQRVGNERRYFLDLNSPCNVAPSFDAGEPYLVTPTIVQWYNNDVPTLPPLTGIPAGYNIAGTTYNQAGTTAIAPPNFRVTFSPRGTVVVPVGGTWAMATQVQMICVLRSVPLRPGQTEFDAVLVTVTPTGRIKLYRWTIGTFRWNEM